MDRFAQDVGQAPQPPPRAPRPRPDVHGRNARARFFQMSLDLFAIWDLQGEVQDVNARWAEVTGWAPEQLRGCRLLDLVHEDDRSDVERAFKLMVSQDRPAHVEMRFRHASGGHRWLDWTMMHEDGLYYGVARDRTDHRDLEALSRAIVEEVEDYAIFMLDREGHVRTWNRGAERCKGYAAEQIIGRHIRVFYPPADSDRPLKLLDTARHLGRAEDEGWRLRRDGSRFWANVVITAVHDREGHVVGFTKLTRDLTQRRRNEESKRKAFQQATEMKQLERLSRMRASLLNMVAHELRTPLTPLRMQVQMLRSPKMGPLNEDQERTVTVLERNIVRVSRLIDDILEVARLEADRLHVQPRLTDAQELVQDVRTTFAPAASQKGLWLEVEAPRDLQMRVDPDRILQVLYNLVDNAIKFTPPGGTVILRVRQDRGIVFEVSDTGRGLSGDERSRLFEPFVQVHNSEAEGSGLGLYISRGIVERHGGNIGCRSEGHGTGSTFWFRLPAGI